MSKADHHMPVEPPGGLDHRFCEVMDAAPVMIWVSGTDKLCTWFNVPWLTFAGRSMAQELGNGWAEGVHRGDYDRCLEIYINHFDKRQEFRMQYRLRHHSGEYRWIDDTGIPRYAHDGTFLGYIGSCIDINAQRVAEEDLRGLKKSLERELSRTTDQKDRLLAVASHDLRQPLQTLFLLNGILRRLPLESNIAAVVAGQESAIAAMSRLLDSLLDISKMQAGAIKPELSDVGLDGLFDELRIEFTGIAAVKGLQFDVVECDAIAHTDVKFLAQILRNILSNAIKFTREGEVQMRCVRADGHLRIDVQDTGDGISPEHLPHIFEEFYQAGTPTKNVREGHGLGLSIVRRLSELLDHQINVNSRMGEGTIFSIVLPIGSEGSRETLRQKADLNTPSGHGHVMVVEDDASVLAAMRGLLESVGYEVTAVSSLAEALNQAHANEDFKFLITDYHLGDGELGTEVVRSVRSVLGPKLEAVLVTGDTTSQMQRTAREYDVHLIKKPINADEFLSLLAHRS
jgi:two-component system, sensor histidine kinase